MKVLSALRARTHLADPARERLKREWIAGAAVVSAAFHAAIVPAHVTESPRLAGLFILASIALLVTAAGLILRPASDWPELAALSLFGTLILAYAVTRLNEPLDSIGVVTKLVEGVGFGLIWTIGADVEPAPRRLWPVGIYILVAVAAITIVRSSGH